MSKSLNLFLPALGGTAMLIALAYGLSTRTYQDQTVASLETQLAQKDASVTGALAQAQEAQDQIAQLLAERDALQAAVASGGGLTEPAPASEAAYNLGRAALPEEVAAWNVDVLPDGRGLPEGSGDVWTGEELFVENCAACHGDFAEGVDNWPVLAGGFDTLANADPVKTVGSYWPYLSTVWDYTHRSMPFGNAGSLSADDTYAIVAYILYSNNLVDDDFALSHENFLDVEMPNAGGFVVDDRAEREYAQWSGEPCMENCKETVEITMRATFLDVTPEEEGTQEEAAVQEVIEETPIESEMAPDAPQEAEVVEADLDPALVAAGEGAFRQCRACHQVGEDARNGTGPQLNGILGRTVGAVEGFRYSTVFAEANAAGEVWDAESFAAFLTDPRGARPGTKMVFRGVRDAAEIDGLIAYIESVSSP